MLSAPTWTQLHVIPVKRQLTFSMPNLFGYEIRILSQTEPKDTFVANLVFVGADQTISLLRET